MRFVDDQQTVGRQIVEQRRRRLAWPAPGEVARVVFDARAVAQLVHHLQIELGTLRQALLFQQLIVLQQHPATIHQLVFDLFHRLQDTFARRHVVRFWIDGVARHGRDNLPGERIEQRQPLHLFVEQLDAQRNIFRLRRKNIDHFTADAEGAALERLIVARILQLRQTTQNTALVDDHAARQVQHHFQIEIGIAQTVNGGDRRHDDNVAPLQQRLGRRETHLLDMFVYRGVFFDKGIGAGHIGFRLIVIVIGDEELHRVIGEELLHLAIKLRRQGFVGCQHHRRPVEIGNDVGDGKRLAGAGYAEQRLMGKTILQPLFETTNRLGLIAGGLESGI